MRGWRSTGIVGAACVQGELRNMRDLTGSGAEQVRERSGVGGAHSTDEAGNDRRGKEPWFGVLAERWTTGRMA